MPDNPDNNPHTHTEAPGVPTTGRLTSRIPNIADWRFRHYLTMQLMPLFYLLLIGGALLAIALIVAICFWFSMLAGLVAALLAPVVFLVTVAVIRAALEYLIMAHRIMRIIERMDALPDQVNVLNQRVDGITGHVDQLIVHVDEIHDSLMQVRPILRSAGLTSRLFNSLLDRGAGRRKE